jgi:hypothetical protein
VVLDQRAALAFGQAAPHTELHTVVERVGEALGDDWTTPANNSRSLLRRSANEEFVGIGGATQRLRDPRAAGYGLPAVVDVGRIDGGYSFDPAAGVRQPGNDYSGAVQRCLSAERLVRGMNRPSPDWGIRVY